MTTHLWRPLSHCDNEGIVIDHAEGVYLYDTFSNRYFDAYSGLWNANLGYSNERIKQAITEQLDKLPFINPLYFSNECAIKLASRICDMISDNMSKVFFSCTGSEAIEVAIKLVRKYSQIKKKPFKRIAVFGNSYHGSYYGSMSASYFEGHNRNGYAPLLEGFISLGIPYIRGTDSDNQNSSQNALLSQLDGWISMHGNDICAIIIEPIIGSGGVIAPDREYMLRLIDYCKRNDILIICDEIACGFGRCGKMFGFQHFDIEPDIVTLSKGLNNGYLPIGATCVSSKIVDAFRSDDEFLFHLSTQNLNPLALAAASANLDQIDNALIEKINESSKFWAQCLERLRRLDSVFSIRVCGLMIAIDLQDRDGSPLSLNRLIDLINDLIRKGVVAGDSFVDGVLSSVLLFPPYIVSKQEIRWCASVLQQSIIETLEN